MNTKRIAAGGILQFRDLCLLGVMSAPDRPGLGAAVFQALGKSHISAQFIVQCIDLHNRSHILFCVPQEDAQAALDSVSPIAEALQAEAVSKQDHVALISVFGPDFRERPGIAGTAFGALAEKGINILAISTSISTVSCVIQNKDLATAIEALHQVFQLP